MKSPPFPPPSPHLGNFSLLQICPGPLLRTAALSLCVQACGCYLQQWQHLLHLPRVSVAAVVADVAAMAGVF